MQPHDLQTIASKVQAVRGKQRTRLMCCGSTACLSSGAEAVRTALDQAVKAQGLAADVHVGTSGCLGLCGRGPLVRREADGEPALTYHDVDAEVAARIVATEAPSAPDVASPDLTAHILPETHPFFARQHKVVLALNGTIDPEHLEDYIAHGGYAAFARVVTTMSPAEACDEVKRSGLRGRGGAGFPTGIKWRAVLDHPGERKFVIANGDEGDPGAYMDRTVMEDLPHQVIEGMLIAGYAVGAQQGYLYVRGEYPLAVKRLEKAIRAAGRQGLLGANIFGTDFSFKLDIRIGAGAFVCGEETALMASVEGSRGVPRMRPPYPAQSGLWGCPTLINNVETFANIAPLFAGGAEKFASVGTEKSKGTKIFALAGKLNQTGLIEVPMGITLREIVFTIGGGIPDGKAFKAAQTGGPSGGCIPAEHLDTPVDYESLRALGAIMGSGGLIVLDETSSMPDVARFFMEFCADESCGKCVPCRVGTVQMHGLLDKIMQQRATPADIEKLQRLGELVKRTSLCGLGQSAPNPVLSTLRYFRHEYDALVSEGQA
ncbi:MAG TPA: NADH-ubiquinone oxidoreductase-F iron-sulfur binding region domain-containing protein [Anaerolineales bacterium]|nr:NADH-ubiquinone oxidoreductase-F iron-sulfur binding region domain-containing protein [Anaerolineales bacterium]